jgi:hypothetical protein
MAVYKGIGTVAIRHAIRLRGGLLEQQLLAVLAPEEAALYKNTVPMALVPIEAGTRIIEKAAPLLFPGDSEAVEKVGQEIANNELKGLYRFLVRHATIPLLIRQAAKLWRIYHTKGHAGAETNGKDHYLLFTVNDYPDLPERFREMMSGYIHGTVALAKKKNIQVLRDSSNPEAWKWHVTWE